MERLVTGPEMKQIDMASIQQIGIPSMVLMERAAMAVTACVKEICPMPKPVLVAAGTGNNGADGLAAARMLADAGYPVTVLWCGKEEHATSEWKQQKAILDQLAVSVKAWDGSAIKKEEAAILIDALFGIGLSREVAGEYRDFIKAINQVGTKVVAVDIPSGVNAENGQILGAAVQAQYTVTFGCGKVGLLLYPGAELAGKVTVADVGFPKKAVQESEYTYFAVDAKDRNMIPKRPEYSNKGTFGKVLILAGSRNMAGAAYFAAKAAFFMGCGLVRILTPEENREVLQTLIPEAVLSTYDSERIDWEQIEEALSWSDVLAVGPGLSTAPYAEALVKKVLVSYRKPAIMDADALNLLAKHPEWESYLGANWILTPHVGELSRLLKKPVSELAKDITQAAKLAREHFPCTVVCKDAVTLTVCPGEKIAVNTTGNSGMAVGGSGDVLTGVIAGLLPVVKEPFRAAYLGVWLHGAAGDRARQIKGACGMGAMDIAFALQGWEMDS